MAVKAGGGSSYEASNAVVAVVLAGVNTATPKVD